MTFKFLKASPIILMLYLLACGFYLSRGLEMAKAEPVLKRCAEKIRDKKPLRIVAFGDSISETGRNRGWSGGASNPEKNWAQVLGVILARRFPGVKVDVINAGIGGQNSYEGLGRADVLEALKPDLVLVQFGANDCAYHFLQPEETKLALKTLALDIGKRFGSDVAIMGTAGDNPLKPFFQHRDETIAASRQAASESDVVFIDVRTPMLGATKNGVEWAEYHLGADNCHPNDKGHDVWGQTVLGALLVVLERRG
jgi:lysophospholipase L1-like esterase